MLPKNFETENSGEFLAGDTTYLEIKPVWDETYGVSKPTEISIAQDGRIFVADVGNQSILVFNQDGSQPSGFHSLINLFKIIKKIEKKMGRRNTLKNYPRICDIDIIDFKGLKLKTHINGHIIEIPHPKMHNRNFVIFPLFELNKSWIHPKTKYKINDIISKFTAKDFSDIRIVKNK